MNHIEAAVAPLKTDAVSRAEQEAQKIIAVIENDLKQVGWDINAVAPYPDSMRLSRKEWHLANSKYRLYHAVVKSRTATYRRGEPNLVDMDTTRIAHFIQDAKDAAAAQYDAFVAKLVAKVGPGVEGADLRGNHVWGESYLMVLKADHQTETWKTQQIVNVSKRGKLFNQWPTRKLKG